MLAPFVPNAARLSTGNDTPYFVPACALRIIGMSTIVLPSRMVIIACHQFMPASIKPPASVYVVITTLMPIQSAAMFQVDQVLSFIVVGARSRFQSGLCETSVCSSTKSRWVVGDSVVIFYLSACRPRLNIYARPALQELSITRFPFELSFIDHDLAAREHSLNNALDLLTLVSIVVAVHVLCFHAQRLFLFRIEEHDVRIGTDSNRALLWKEPEHLRGRG